MAAEKLNHQLDDKQKKRLMECEQGIADSEFGSGKHFKQIMQEGLHKAYGTFDEYCKKQWGFSRVHVKRLINAHECLENLQKNQIGSVCVPTTESQARIIARLKAEDQTKVAKEVKTVLGDARPTAEHFKTAAIKLGLVKTKEKTAKTPKAAAVPVVAKPVLKDGQERIELVALVNDGDIRGVYWTEELALLSLLPVEVQPHVHCLIEADEVDESALLKLKDLVSQHLKAHCESALEPNIKVNSITSDSSLFHHLRYMVKPINLVKAYDLAWTGAASHNRHQVHGLNSQMTDLVQGYSIVTTGRRKMNSKGNLDFRAKSFIGVHKKGHKKYLGHLKRINEQPHEYIEMPENDEESQTP